MYVNANYVFRSKEVASMERIRPNLWVIKLLLKKKNCLKDSFLKGYFLQNYSHMQPNNESGAVETVHRNSCSNVYKHLTAGKTTGDYEYL